MNSSSVTLKSREKYVQKGLHDTRSTNLFSNISKKDLISLGVQPSDIQLIYSIPDMKTFETYKVYFPNDVYANLEWIATEMHVKEIISYNRINRKQLLNFIKENVLFPALACKELSQDIKDSVQDTFERLELKNSTKEILDFFEDALIARRGIIHEEFLKHNLKGFEEIADEVRKLGKA